MFEETTSKTVKSIKWVWWFLKEELPQFFLIGERYLEL